MLVFKDWERIKVSQFAVPSSNNVMILAVLLVIVATSIIDSSIVKLSAFTGGLTATFNIIAFSVLVLIYIIGQYFILGFIKRKIQISKITPVNTIHKIVSTIQYVLIGVLVIIILQMIFTSSYTLLFLKLVVLISCSLSIVLLGILAIKFFSWFRLKHDTIIIFYAIAMGILSVNIFFMIVTVMSGLTPQPADIQLIESPVSIVTNANNTFNLIYVITSVLSFVFVWVATVLLLRYYSKKIGTARYWIIVSAPLFYFLSQFQAIFIDLFESFRLSDPTLFGIVFTLIFGLSKPIGGILFGVAFWSVSRIVSKHTIKDYLMISAFGIVLLFTSNQATSLLLAPFPPFGLVTTSLLGLSSYMLLIGIYSSAISISSDTELRKFIRTIAVNESKLLDHIGYAQMHQELVKTIIPLIHSKAQEFEQETGIVTSFTDLDMKQYLDHVLTELKNLKKD